MCQRVYMAVILGGACAFANAGELVHQFIDPGFGGSPFNNSYVMGIPSAQDQTKDPSAASYSSGYNPYSQSKQSFSDLVQQSLEQRLISKVVTGLIGDSTTAITPGSYTFGGDQVTVSINGLGSTVVTIVDPNGKSTQVEIPK
jgi:hypothetical protein